MYPIYTAALGAASSCSHKKITIFRSALETRYDSFLRTDAFFGLVFT